jgi:hypothetical protein
MKSILNLGYGPISEKNLANKVAKGEVVDSVTSGRQEYIEAALNALMFG